MLFHHNPIILRIFSWIFLLLTLFSSREFSHCRIVPLRLPHFAYSFLLSIFVSSIFLEIYSYTLDSFVPDRLINVYLPWIYCFHFSSVVSHSDYPLQIYLLSNHIFPFRVFYEDFFPKTLSILELLLSLLKLDILLIIYCNWHD